MAPEPRAHAVSERIDVAVDAQHLLARFLTGGDRVARMCGIDEHEVEVLEPRFLVVDHRIRRRRHRAVFANGDTLRAERAEMQPDRRRARSAVKDKAHRARRRVRVREKIGRSEKGRFGLAALFVQAAGRHRHECRDRRVFHRAAIQHNARFALERVLGEQLVDLFSESLLCFFSGRSGWRWFAHEQKESDVFCNDEGMPAPQGLESSRTGVQRPSRGVEVFRDWPPGSTGNTHETEPGQAILMLELRILCRLPTEEIRMAEPIHQEVTIDAVPADVYAALTEATRFAEVTAAPASMEA